MGNEKLATTDLRSEPSAALLALMLATAAVRSFEQPRDHVAEGRDTEARLAGDRVQAAPVGGAAPSRAPRHPSCPAPTQSLTVAHGRDDGSERPPANFIGSTRPDPCPAAAEASCGRGHQDTSASRMCDVRPRSRGRSCRSWAGGASTAPGRSRSSSRRQITDHGNVLGLRRMPRSCRARQRWADRRPQCRWQSPFGCAGGPPGVGDRALVHDSQRDLRASD